MYTHLVESKRSLPNKRVCEPPAEGNEEEGEDRAQQVRHDRFYDWKVYQGCAFIYSFVNVYRIMQY